MRVLEKIMSSAMSWIKVVAINIAIAFGLIGFILLIPPFVFYASEAANFFKSSSIDSRASLDLYSEYEWAHHHFVEDSEVPIRYFDFVTWRREDYDGKTINIKNGVRKTINPNSEDSSKFWFFGGSTTWGTGVNDQNTYSSLFANSTSHHVTNFGETAYIARQSLAYLNNHLIINNIQDLENINVIFYDGVNDIAHRCRREISSLGTGRENQIRNKLFLSSSSKFGLSGTFNQLQDFLGTVLNKIFLNSQAEKPAANQYSCASDSERALEVAESLVNTWQVASDLVQGKGGEFTAILQPVAYIGNSYFPYLDLSSSNDVSLASQYNAVYPLIVEIVNKRNIQFLNLTSVYDQCTNCYIDFCHTGPQGHQLLSNKLVSIFGE